MTWKIILKIDKNKEKCVKKLHKWKNKNNLIIENIFTYDYAWTNEKTCLHESCKIKWNTTEKINASWKKSHAPYL